MRTFIAMSVAFLGTFAFVGEMPTFGQQATAFSRTVPAADHDKYKSVRDAKDWANPYLVVLRDGVQLTSSAVPSGRKVMAVSELRAALLGLPTSAWPYGRVVALQENGLRSAPDDKLIMNTRLAAETVLKALPVEIDRWPSAEPLAASR